MSRQRFFPPLYFLLSVLKPARQSVNVAQSKRVAFCRKQAYLQFRL